MQKIKYIIFFILILGVAFLYLQLTDYNKISQSLIQENTSSTETITTLENNITTLQEEKILLNDEIASLKQTIFILEEELTLFKLLCPDNNATQNLQDDTNNTNESLPQKTLDEKSIFDRFFNR